MLRLHFTEQGDGPPVVLLHGLFGTGSNLGGLGRELSEDHRVLLPDLRNHGRSPWDDCMTYQAMAEDVQRLLDHLEIGPCALVGHSMGGKIAMQMALTRPERLTHLVVADIAPVAYGHGHENVLVGLRSVASMKPVSRQEADELLSEWVVDAATRAFLLKSLKRQPDGHYEWSLNWRIIEREYSCLAEAPAGKPYPHPVMFIKGSESDYIRTSQQPAVMALFPKAQLRVIQGAGHWLHADKPHSFNRLVRQAITSA